MECTSKKMKGVQGKVEDCEGFRYIVYDGKILGGRSLQGRLLNNLGQFE